jgi:hypothetical protein
MHTFHIKTHGLPRNRKRTTCAICSLKSVLKEEGIGQDPTLERVNKRSKNISDDFQHRSGAGKS